LIAFLSLPGCARELMTQIKPTAHSARTSPILFLI
jgi:hypothetical protein